MTNSNPNPDIKIREVKRTDLWYQSYRYMARLGVNEPGCLRRLDHAHINKVIDIRRKWGRRISRQPGSWSGGFEPLVITDKDIDTLHQLCDFFTDVPGEYRITITWNAIYFYTNDFGLIKQLHDMPFLSDSVEVSKVQLQGQPRSIVLNKSDYSLRTYMRWSRLSPECAASVRRFLGAQSDLQLCPTFSSWIDSTSTLLKDYYFFDHNGMGVLAMLGLIDPKILRKTMPIITDK